MKTVTKRQDNLFYSAVFLSLHNNFTRISSGLPETVFLGLGRTEYLSLADNSMTTVPHHILRLMPIIKTLDMGRCKVTSLTSGDFKVT